MAPNVPVVSTFQWFDRHIDYFLHQERVFSPSTTCHKIFYFRIPYMNSKFVG